MWCIQYTICACNHARFYAESLCTAHNIGLGNDGDTERPSIVDNMPCMPCLYGCALRGDHIDIVGFIYGIVESNKYMGLSLQDEIFLGAGKNLSTDLEFLKIILRDIPENYNP